MKLYQIEHDNCESYEENYHYREDKVYINKETLIKHLKDNGYVEKIFGYPEDDYNDMYYKDNIEDMPLFREDKVTIHELTVEDK